eukprot:2262074-Karenia_brevis.AAC.1
MPIFRRSVFGNCAVCVKHVDGGCHQGWDWIGCRSVVLACWRVVPSCTAPSVAMFLCVVANWVLPWMARSCIAGRNRWYGDSNKSIGGYVL